MRSLLWCPFNPACPDPPRVERKAYVLRSHIRLSYLPNILGDRSSFILYRNSYRQDFSSYLRIFPHGCWWNGQRIRGRCHNSQTGLDTFPVTFINFCTLSRPKQVRGLRQTSNARPHGMKFINFEIYQKLTKNCLLEDKIS